MCHERSFASQPFVFPSSNYSFIFLVYAILYLFYPFLSFTSILPFFPPVWRLLCLCQAFYGGSAGRTTKPQDAHTQPRYTLYSINSAHTQEKLAHTQSPCWHTGLHPDSPSSTSQCECMTDLHHLKHFQLFPPGLCDAPRWSPTAQEAQREDDKLSIRAGSGEFSSCLHTLCETSLSRPHVGSREALIWLRLCHGRTWAELLFSSHPWSCYDVLLLKIGLNSPGKREKRFPGWGCSSGCNCSQRHDELVYKTT